ncbi:MAG: TolC family protein [Burkholderiales bacterium]
MHRNRPTFSDRPRWARFAAALCALAAAQLAAAENDPFAIERLRPPRVNAAWAATVPDPCPPDAQLPSSLSLVQAVDIALCRNPQTRQTWANARVFAEQVGVARAAQLPTLSADLTGQRNETRNVPGAGGQTQFNAGLSANYVLFDFGAREATLENARQSLLAANWTHNATLQQVLFATAQAYYGLFAATENVAATLAAEQSAKESLDAAQARLAAGRGTRADLLQAQTAYSQAQLNRTRAQGSAATARGTLANALGFDADRDLLLSPPPDVHAQAVMEEAVASLIARAQQQRPDLLAAQAQVRAAESSIRATEAQGKPTVSAFASASAAQVSPGFDPRNGAIGVQISIPIFTGYENTYQIRAARQRLEVQRAARDKAASDIALDVWTAYHSMRTESQALRTSLDLVASAQESYRAALARYKAGVGTLIDVLNAQSAQASANSQKIQSQYNWYIAKASLVRSLGVLDVGVFTGTGPATESPSQR